MGRLAVILGSNALGPGGGEIAAATSEHGAAVVQRHVDGGRLRPPARDRLRRQPAAAGRAGLRPGAGDRLGRQPAHRPAGRQLRLPGRLHRPAPGPLDLRRRPRPHRARPSRRAGGGEVVDAWGAEDGEPAVDGGVYWQTIGPRFETPAEIRMMAPHADLVGMTIASECIIAGELGLEYAAICVVDNLANGLAEGDPLGRGDGSRPADQRDPPARRARRGAAAPRRGRPVSARAAAKSRGRIAGRRRGADGRR